jgi:glycosyltransferase involved in cell wall biosynthesis
MPQVTVDLERLKTLHCGLGQYCLHLGRALANTAGDIELTYFLPRDKVDSFQGLDVHFQHASPWRREVWQRPLRWLPLSKGRRVDLWHATHQQTKYLPVDPRTPVLLTIHDLNFLREARPAKIRRELARVQRLIDRACAVTAISQFVAGEVREHFNLRGKPLHVIHNGACVGMAQPQRPAWLTERTFLFTIGDITPKKNFHVLVDFIGRVPNRQLIIAGRKGHAYAAEIEQLARERGLSDRVLLPGAISDGERAWLYQHCEALVFPSKTEGFGLPVIEAMTAGRPVFCSHATSLPEVTGPHGFFWHDYSPDHMAEVFYAGMKAFERDASYSSKLKSWAGQFTWQRAATEYLRVYRETLALSGSRKAA